MPVNLSEKHPQYSLQLDNWVLMRDAYRGERQVKSKGQLYLPATSGQIADGMERSEQPGFKSYMAYLKRARFPNFVREAVQTAVGMMHSQPPKISLPKELEGIRSSKGEGLPHLLRRINEEQLLTGRIGLLADIPTRTADPLPYIATYSTERLINWDDGTVEGLVPQVLNFVVLDESEYERNKLNFGWTLEEKYRVLTLGPLETDESVGSYRFGVFDTRDPALSDASLKEASIRGRTLDKIPFIIVNSCDLVSETDEPPLMDLGNLCMTIYRGEADYRQNLFMQGQDTLVIVGGSHDEDDTVRTGAGSRIDVPMGGDAKYIGVESDGLSEQREALVADRQRAGSMGAQSLDTVSRERESGTSLNIRIAARTADLNQIALTGAAGLERLLKICAEWVGADPEEVKIEPNLEFGDNQLTGQTMVEMQTARNLGYPISARSLHQVAIDRGLTKLTFEEEMARAKEEEDGPFKRADNGDRTPEQSDGNGPNDPPSGDPKEKQKKGK
jgi:hypothetical protein